MRAQKPASAPPAPTGSAASSPPCARKALESDIVIVNHHLFFADLAINAAGCRTRRTRRHPARSAPPVIFDEAHELEEVASNYFGIGLSTQRFDELTRDIELMLKAKDSLSRAPSSVPAPACMIVASACSLPHSPPRRIAVSGRMPFERRADFLEERACDYYTATLNALTCLEGELERVKNIDEIPGLRATAPRRSAAASRSLLELHRPQHRLLDSNAGQRAAFATWSERHTRLPSTRTSRPHRSTSRSSSPPSLFDAYCSVILTSATLTVASTPKRQPDASERIRLRLRPHPQASRPLHDGANLSSPATSTTRSRRCSTCRPTFPIPNDPDFASRAAERIRRVLEITPRAVPSASSPATAPCSDMHERTHLHPASLPAAPARQPPRATSCCSNFATRPTPSCSAPPASGRESMCRASSSPASSSTACPSPSPPTPS